MRRLLIIGVVVLPAVLLVAVFALPASPSGLPHQVTTAVYAYLDYRASPSQPMLGVQQIIPASRPWSFTRQMSKATFGNSVYFKTDYRSTGRGIPAAVTSWPGEGSLVGGRSLPFPPTALWCVRLQPTEDAHPDIVYVAQHEDDYKADWIVHIPAAQTTQELEASLATLGCNEVESP